MTMTALARPVLRLVAALAVMLGTVPGLLPLPVLQAQDLPSCGRANVGALACMGGKQCSCSFTRGGTMTGEPDGYRWDCGVMRPMCPPEQSILPYQGPLPEAVDVYNDYTLPQGSDGGYDGPSYPHHHGHLRDP